MSATTVSTAPHRSPSTVRESVGQRLLWQARDARAVTWRNLLVAYRTPEVIIFTIIQPVMFILLFRYVFGGSIRLPAGIDYPNYLLPGVFCQTVVFGAASTAVGLAEDLQKGFVDRFRSLPMSRSAVLVGRTTADLLRNVVVLAVMLVAGVAVGFRPHVLGLLVSIPVLLAFSYAFSWPMALVGLVSKTSEAAQTATFPLLFPLTFASSAFVPTAGMPGWLRAFADHQPFTLATDAVRSLSFGRLDPDVRQQLLQGHSSAYYVLLTLVWAAGLTAVFGWLAVRRYRRT